MDRTQLNIISILLGAVVIFAVIRGFTVSNVPEVSMTFFDTNPFVVKRDAIESTNKLLFAAVALVGIALKLYVEIRGERLPARSHDSQYYYMNFCVVGCFAGFMLVYGIDIAGDQFARSQW